MKTIIIEAEGWSCTLEECPSGLFVYREELCFKTDYSPEGNLQVFCNNGDAFWGATDTDIERRKLIVQPVTSRWEDTER